MQDKAYIEELVDALDHIMRVAKASRTQTRRLRWIAERARCAIDGGEDWRELDLPKTAELSLRERKMRLFIEKALGTNPDTVIDNQRGEE